MNKTEITFKGSFELISFYELSPEQQEEIKEDYDSIEDSSFFVDGENVHDLNSFMRVTEHQETLKSFHGYDTTCFFHTYLIILDDSNDGVKLFDQYCA